MARIDELTLTAISPGVQINGALDSEMCLIGKLQIITIGSEKWAPRRMRTRTHVPPKNANWRGLRPDSVRTAKLPPYMKASRKKLGVTLLIDDATLRAIGHVAAQWAVLEIEFNSLLSQLLRHPDAKGIALDRIPQAFDRRAGLLKQCAERLLSNHQAASRATDRDYQRCRLRSGS